MFEKDIEEYERIRLEYQQKVADRMSHEQWMEYNEILFSAHSCAIEGNSFTVDDTRILREQGMAMIPVGRTLLECTEIADHFRAFDYMVSHLDHPFDETLLKEINRLTTEHTLSYRTPGAVAGGYGCWRYDVWRPQNTDSQGSHADGIHPKGIVRWSAPTCCCG